MNCHVTSVTSGILNLNYIIKVAKNDTMFHVYKYVPSTIKITNPTKKKHYVNIISQNSHLMIDPLSGFAQDVNRSFFEKCVNSKDFLDTNCNVVFQPIGDTCFSSIFHVNHSATKFLNQCKLQVLGEKSTEVTLISNTCSTIYSGFEHNVFAKCNNFEAERILRPGVTKVTLLNANKCTFQSNFYFFTLSGYENAKDTLYHQNIPQIIKDFSNYSID